MSQGNTAILFFSRTLNDEFHAKSFGLTRKRFARLYRFFINKTLGTARASGIPVIEAFSNEQVGNSFAEKLINALEHVKSKGFRHVIIIGNDTPELSVSDLQIAEKALASGKQVLGKDERGGTYLIGLDLESIQLSRLSDIEWHSAKVYAQLRSLMGSIYELGLLTDLNKYKDVLTFITNASALSRNVLRFFRRLFSTSTFDGLVIGQYHAFQIAICGRRGPPLNIL